MLRPHKGLHKFSAHIKNTYKLGYFLQQNIEMVIFIAFFSLKCIIKLGSYYRYMSFTNKIKHTHPHSHMKIQLIT